MGDSCTVVNVGYIDVDVANVHCDTSPADADCDDSACTEGNLTGSATVSYLAVAGYTGGDRDVMVCQYFFECGGTTAACTACEVIRMGPAAPASVAYPSALSCDNLGSGTYQYKVAAVDIENISCSCSESCWNGCATNCYLGYPSHAHGCCMAL